jgi:hypothetical protein
MENRPTERASGSHFSIFSSRDAQRTNAHAYPPQAFVHPQPSAAACSIIATAARAGVM